MKKAVAANDNSLRNISLPTAHLLAQREQECSRSAKTGMHQPPGQGVTAKETLTTIHDAVVP
jgi:hypothetical protein